MSEIIRNLYIWLFRDAHYEISYLSDLIMLSIVYYKKICFPRVRFDEFSIVEVVIWNCYALILAIVGLFIKYFSTLIK